MAHEAQMTRFDLDAFRAMPEIVSQRQCKEFLGLSSSAAKIPFPVAFRRIGNRKWVSRDKFLSYMEEDGGA